MKISSNGAAVKRDLKSGMKIANKGAEEIKDTFTPSSAPMEEISFKKPCFKKEKYVPDYNYGRVTNSCGGMEVEWVETRDLTDIFTIKGQLDIDVIGLPDETPAEYKSSKKFTGLKKHKYEYGRILPPSCGDIVTVGWGTTMSRKKAEKIAKEHNTSLRYPPHRY